jgi:PAS domain-containing protein
LNYSFYRDIKFDYREGKGTMGGIATAWRTAAVHPLLRFYWSRQRQLPSAGWIQMMALLDKLNAMAVSAHDNNASEIGAALAETRSALLLDVCDVGASIAEDFSVPGTSKLHRAGTLDDDFNYLDLLYELKLPFYMTDAQGIVQMYSPAAAGFWGWSPRIGEQRWCGSWQLATEDGEPLELEACPMADCIRNQAAIRGKRAVAIRPDGTQRRFAPLPTPVIDGDGRMVAALNVLIEVPSQGAR